MLRIDAILLLTALPLVAQTANIEGTVTNAVTGAPVPRAHVTLEGQIDGQSGRYGATSAADGRFSITGIAPGSYTLAGERVGFVRFLGLRRQDRIALKTDDNKTSVDIRLTPTGTIMGRVTDSDGQPVEGAFVIVEGGHEGVNAATDEDGQFRLGGLAPGKYRVKASQEDILGGRPEIRTDGTAEVHNAASYYPGVLGKKEAGRVTVRAGGESTGTDIQLVRVPFVRVSGKVVGIPPGVDEASVMVWQGAGGSGTEIKPDGSFELWRLDPGKYRLSAEWNMADGEQGRTAGTEIEVAGSNIDRLELRVVAPSSIPGRLEFDDDIARQAVPKDVESRKLILTPAEGDVMGQVSASVDDKGAFHLDKVPPGKYRVQLSWNSIYVRSMRLGSQTIVGAVLDLSSGSSGADLSLVLSAHTGSVAGTVRDDSGNAVGGASVTLWDSERQFGQQTASKADGTYGFTGLIPGSYLIGVTDDLDDDDVMESIDIGPGEKVIKDLKREDMRR